jgi:hypothetical protein
MNWFSARAAERSTQVALSQLLALWAGILANYISGAGTVPMNIALAGGITATVPLVIQILMPEVGKPNPPQAGS